MKHLRKLAAGIICLAAMLISPCGALAAGGIDMTRAPSLRISTAYESAPIAGMVFDAYLIADVDAQGELSPAPAYSKYADALDIRGRNDEAWGRLAQTLTQEIIADSTRKASCTAATRADGQAEFADIGLGLYLIIGQGVEKDGFVYSTAPFFVMLPEQDMTVNEWRYDVHAAAKPAREAVKADFEVIKLWDDACHSAQRPQSISVQLFCDGALYDTVTLPHDGAWRYGWTGLETNHIWTVAEKQEAGYKPPDIQREGNAFIITNTCAKPAEPGAPTLPQTGQLWWPVPVLIAAGLALVVIGLARRRRQNNAR